MSDHTHSVPTREEVFNGREETRLTTERNLLQRRIPNLKNRIRDNAAKMERLAKESAEMKQQLEESEPALEQVKAALKEQRELGREIYAKVEKSGKRKHGTRQEAEDARHKFNEEVNAEHRAAKRARTE